MREDHGEKEEERSRGWEGCWRSDRVDATGWAAIFIWGGLVLLAETTNIAADSSWWDGWAVFFTGAGVIVLFEAVIRLFLPEYRQPLVWNLICGFVLLGIGLNDLVNWSWVWALALVAIGIIILQGTFGRRR